MAVKVKTEAKDISNEHYISNYSAFLDSDDDFYLINVTEDLIVRLVHSGCEAFMIPAGMDTIECFLTKTFGEHVFLKRAYENGDDYNITVEAG